jgi:hypothetical protein
MNSFELQANGLKYEIQKDRLAITRDGSELASLCMAPVIDGKTKNLSSWEAAEPEHYVAQVEAETSIHLALKQGRPCFWMETDRQFMEQLTYFSDGHLHGGAWHSFVPDEWDRTWDCERDIEVAASSNYLGMSVDGGDGAGMTDPGDRPPTWIFNIPAHHCAWKVSPEEWLGICLPHPHALGVVRYGMERERFSLSFDAVQTTCAESGCPVVYFEGEMSEPYELCERHYDLSLELGLTRAQVSKDHPDWWSHPYYKSYDDMLRTEQEEGGYSGHFKVVDGKPRCVLNTERIKKWHALVEEKTGLEGRINMFFDQVYFYHYGGYDKVIDEFGGVEGFRKTIDEWQERGVHTGLYFHQYTISKDSDFYKAHPEACLKPKDESVVYRHGVTVGSSETTYVDWTHPATRTFMLGMVEFLLSDEAGCLNGDWLAINNNIGPDPRAYEFHDPAWGIGDLMQFKVQKLIYEKAKLVKPHCLVRRQSPTAPYMEPYCDEAHLCEEWNGSTNAWWRRARLATRLMKNSILGFDPWFVTLTKGYEYYQGLAAVMVPATEASTHAIHPYMYWRPLQERDYRRRMAGMQVYMHAPQWRSDQKHVSLTPEGRFKGAWRKRTEGPLAGFYAALALTPRTLITYSGEQALISSSESRMASIPLPLGAKVQSVERVKHDTRVEDHEYAQDGESSIRLHVEDCGGATLYLRVRYECRE